MKKQNNVLERRGNHECKTEISVNNEVDTITLAPDVCNFEKPPTPFKLLTTWDDLPFPHTATHVSRTCVEQCIPKKRAAPPDPWPTVDATDNHHHSPFSVTPTNSALYRHRLYSRPPSVLRSVDRQWYSECPRRTQPDKFRRRRPRIPFPFPYFPCLHFCALPLFFFLSIGLLTADTTLVS